MLFIVLKFYSFIVLCLIVLNTLNFLSPMFSVINNSNFSFFCFSNFSLFVFVVTTLKKKIFKGRMGGVCGGEIFNIFGKGGEPYMGGR